MIEFILGIFAICVLILLGIFSVNFLSGSMGIDPGLAFKAIIIIVVTLVIIYVLAKYQIIENGIIGLLCTFYAYSSLHWHGVFCLVFGFVVIVLLEGFSHTFIGFWIKTLFFSTLITYLAYSALFSEDALASVHDKIWKAAFVVFYFIENVGMRALVHEEEGFGDPLSLPEFHFTKKKQEKELSHHKEAPAATEQTVQKIIPLEEFSAMLHKYNESEEKGQEQRPIFDDTEEKRTYKDNHIHQTARGEKVRSKSEVIIANLMHSKNIAYEYEPEIKFDEATLHPDFRVHDPKTGKVWYWEHCGMLNDPKYVEMWERKRALYAKHGIVEGDNLIVTKDDAGGGIDSSHIEAIVNLMKSGQLFSQEKMKCPLCGGNLILMDGMYGKFWGCSNFKSLGCRYTAKYTE